MKKKDYELIATELRLELMKYREHQEQPGYPDRYRAIWGLAYRLVHELEQQNPKFNRSKFLQACGIEEV